MHIQTIEDNFDYQFKHALKEMHREYTEEDTSMSFEDYVWTNRKILGEKLYTQAMEHYDIDELIAESID